jgi:hypothetical protein
MDALTHRKHTRPSQFLSTVAKCTCDHAEEVAFHIAKICQKNSKCYFAPWPSAVECLSSNGRPALMSIGFSDSLPGIFYIDFLYLYLSLVNKHDDDDQRNKLVTDHLAVLVEK